MKTTAIRTSRGVALSAALLVAFANPFGIALADEAADASAPIELVVPEADQTPEISTIEAESGDKEAPTQEFGHETSDAAGEHTALEADESAVEEPTLDEVADEASALVPAEQPTEEPELEQPTRSPLRMPGLIPTPETLAPEAPEADATEAPLVVETPTLEPDATAAVPPATPQLPLAETLSTQLLPPNTARFVTFTITDEEGHPVPSAHVRLYPQPYADPIYVTANSAGVATAASLPYGDYKVEVVPGQNRKDMSSVFLDGAADFDSTQPITINRAQHSYSVTLPWVETDALGGIDLTVVDASSGEVVPNIGFTVYKDGVLLGSYNSDHTGGHTFRGLEPGNYTFWYAAIGGPFAASPQTFAVVNDLPVIARWGLQPISARNLVPVSVADNAGNLVENARVCLHHNDGGAPGGEALCKLSHRGVALFYGGIQYGHTLGRYFIHVEAPANTDYRSGWLTDTPGLLTADPALAHLKDLTHSGVHPFSAKLAHDAVADDDFFSTTMNRAFIMPDETQGVLANDYSDGSPLGVHQVQGVNVQASGSTTAATSQGGTVGMDRLGRFAYVPPADFVGVDTFEYAVFNIGGPVATATVHMTVTDPNAGNGDDDDPTPIVLRNDSYTTPYGTLLDVTGDCDALGVGANDDGDIRDFVLHDNAQHGSLDLEDKGCFTYLPDAGFSGTDTFVYTVTDGNGDPTYLTATVTITVGEADVDPNAPVANNDEYQVKAGLSFVVPEASAGLLANDTGNSPLSVYSVLGDPVVPGFEIFTTQGNTLRVSLDGTFTFVPRAGFTGVDDVTYIAIDEDGLRSQPATARFVVSAAEPTPTPTSTAPTATPGPSMTGMPAPSPSPTGGTLAKTGAEASVLAVLVGIGAALMGGGTVLTALKRRRENTKGAE